MVLFFFRSVDDCTDVVYCLPCAVTLLFTFRTSDVTLGSSWKCHIWCVLIASRNYLGHSWQERCRCKRSRRLWHLHELKFSLYGTLVAKHPSLGISRSSRRNDKGKVDVMRWQWEEWVQLLKMMKVRRADSRRISGLLTIMTTPRSSGDLRKKPIWIGWKRCGHRKEMFSCTFQSSVTWAPRNDTKIIRTRIKRTITETHDQHDWSHCATGRRLRKSTCVTLCNGWRSEKMFREKKKNFRDELHKEYDV